MNRRERVMAAIDHQPPDRVPWSITLTPPTREELADFYNRKDLNDPDVFDRWAGNHLKLPAQYENGFHKLEEEIAPGIWLDRFGITWDTRGMYGEGEWGRPLNPVLSRPSLTGYSFPDPPGPDHFRQYDRFIEQNRDYFRLGDVGSLFETAWALRGMEDLLKDMIRHPAFVNELLDAILDYNLSVLPELAKRDFDALQIGDDWGSERGLIMGPRLWREYIKPRLAKMITRVKDAGKTVFLHSDGDLSAIFDDLIEIGLDVYNPLQPEILNVYEVHKKYGDRLCFWGGIGLRSTLFLDSPAAVEANVHRLIRDIGADGGLIVAQAHPDGILADAPLQNIIALIEAVREQ